MLQSQVSGKYCRSVEISVTVGEGAGIGADSSNFDMVISIILGLLFFLAMDEVNIPDLGMASL
jgi:hypothetical protein